VEYIDEGSAGVAKDALHNYKLDGENKIKVTFSVYLCCRCVFSNMLKLVDNVCQEVIVMPFGSQCDVLVQSNILVYFFINIIEVHMLSDPYVLCM